MLVRKILFPAVVIVEKKRKQNERKNNTFPELGFMCDLVIVR